MIGWIMALAAPVLFGGDMLSMNGVSTEPVRRAADIYWSCVRERSLNYAVGLDAAADIADAAVTSCSDDQLGFRMAVENEIAPEGVVLQGENLEKYNAYVGDFEQTLHSQAVLMVVQTRSKVK